MQVNPEALKLLKYSMMNSINGSRKNLKNSALDINFRSSSSVQKDFPIQLFKVAGPKGFTVLLYFSKYYHQILQH